jgi:carbon starvation protein
MNGMLVILVAAVALVCGYVVYGRWLAKSWGVDPQAITPARRMEDGRDFSPATRFSRSRTSSARSAARALSPAPSSR